MGLRKKRLRRRPLFFSSLLLLFLNLLLLLLLIDSELTDDEIEKYGVFNGEGDRAAKVISAALNNHSSKLGLDAVSDGGIMTTFTKRVSRGAKRDGEGGERGVKVKVPRVSKKQKDPASSKKNSGGESVVVQGEKRQQKKQK